MQRIVVERQLGMVADAFKRKPPLLRRVLRHGQPQRKFAEAVLQCQLEGQVELHRVSDSVPSRLARARMGLEAALGFPALNAVLQHLDVFVTEHAQREHGLCRQ